MLRARLLRPLSLLSLLLIGACRNPLNQEDGGDAATRGPERGYEIHVVAYSDCLRDADQSVLENVDTVIMGDCNLQFVRPEHMRRAVLYFDMWGKSSYITEPTRPRWQIGPGNLDMPEVFLNDQVYCYRFDDAHVERFLGWIESFLQEHGHEVKGVFLDDFAWNRNWWSGSDEDRDLVWGPMDGRPGWRDQPSTWNRERVLAIEAGALALVRQYIGPDGVVIVNGPFRTLPEVRRFAENVGTPNNEAWDRLEQEGVDDFRYARSGDMLQVNGLGGSGVWGDWCDTDAGNGWDNLLRACDLAMERSLSVGLAYGETPDDGGTQYKLLLDPAEPGSEWPGFVLDTAD